MFHRCSLIGDDEIDSPAQSEDSAGEPGDGRDVHDADRGVQGNVPSVPGEPPTIAFTPSGEGGSPEVDRCR
jgi:hypothetical protein